MNTPDYWKKRLEDTAQEAADKNIDEIIRRQRRVYLQAGREIEHQVTALYERIRRDGEVTPLSLYKKQRFEKMRRQVKAELKKLGARQVKNCEEGFSQAVIDGYNDTGKLFNITFDRISKDFVNQIAHSEWSGEEFSKRIWSNMSSLARNVEKAVVNSVVAGRGKDEAVREIMKATGQSFANSDRLVRTEVMHCINQAQANIYRQAGATRYEVLVGIDERTCPTCAAMDGAVFPFSQMREGVNAPVFHPRCRCTIVPVLDGDVLQKLNVVNELDFPAATTTVIDALHRLPQKHQAILEPFIPGVEIIPTASPVNSGFIRSTKTLRIREDATPGDIIHEFGHALASALQIENDPIYTAIKNAGIDNYGADDILVDSTTFTEEILRIEHHKFISKYQGRVYWISDKTIDASGKLNTEQLREYFSEGYREFLENPNNLKKHDPDLYHYLEELVK